MELLVNNKIISLDLPVKDVYNKVIQFFCSVARLQVFNILFEHLLPVYKQRCGAGAAEPPYFAGAGAVIFVKKRLRVS